MLLHRKFLNPAVIANCLQYDLQDIAKNYIVSLARILQWVAMPSSRGSSQLRNQTHIFYVSSIVTGFFTTSATWEALITTDCKY